MGPAQVLTQEELPSELVAEQEAIVGVEVSNQQGRVPSFAVVVEDVIRVGGVERPAGRAFALRVAPTAASSGATASRRRRAGRCPFSASASPRASPSASS